MKRSGIRLLRLAFFGAILVGVMTLSTFTSAEEIEIGVKLELICVDDEDSVELSNESEQVKTPEFFSARALSIDATTENLEVEYYGRSALAGLSNSDALLAAYDALAAGVEGSVARIDIDEQNHSVTIGEFRVVLDAYMRDFAHHFWLGTNFGLGYNKDDDENSENNIVLWVQPKYIMSGNELETAKEEFNQAVDSILAGIDDSMSEFEKELYLHDTLAERIVYTLGVDNDHDAYGAIVKGECVCEGYAEALQYLLQRVGIQSFLALGLGVKADGKTENHEWNYVRIDGKYYHVDLTWDDQESRTYHAYFNVPDSVIMEDHMITATTYALPECKSEDANYFTVLGGRVSDYNADLIGAMLGENNLEASVYVEGDINSFLRWYKENIVSIAVKAGISGMFSYGSISFGREVVLILSNEPDIKIEIYNADVKAVGIYSDVVGKYTVVFADYGDGGVLNKVDSVIYDIQKGTNVIPQEDETLTLDTGDKIFVWKDMSTFVPACRELVIN